MQLFVLIPYRCQANVSTLPLLYDQQHTTSGSNNAWMIRDNLKTLRSVAMINNTTHLVALLADDLICSLIALRDANHLSYGLVSDIIVFHFRRVAGNCSIITSASHR